MTPALPASLLETLELVSRVTAPARHPWWIIGGAAMRLHGAFGTEPTDVDVLLHPEDARAILANAGIGKTGDGGNGRFRSQVYGTITTAPLPIDILGGFEVHDGTHWQAVAAQSMETVELSFGAVRLPSLPELITITRQLARPRDLQRVEILDALMRDRLVRSNHDA